MQNTHNGKNSIFVKYFTICAALTVVCLTVLGVLLTTFATQFFKEDKYDILKANAQKAAKFTSSQISINGSTLMGARIESFYGMLASAIDSNVFLTNADGKVIYCTEPMPCVHTTFTVPKNITEQTLRGEYRETGNFEGVYKEKCYSVGVPVVIDSGQTVGFIYASMPAKQMTSFFKDLFRLFIICEIIVLGITFILVYIVTRQLSRPLQNMSVVAQKIGNGDFSSRLAVESDDEIGQLASALNNMSVSLSTLENSRRSFVANVSHELKTPMTSIGGFIDGILDGTIPPEKQEHYLKIVSEEVKRLTRLVRSMLNLSRIEAGETKIHYSKFNVVDAVCDSVFSFEKNIEAKNLTVEGLDMEKLIIEADRDMIHQVIYNLTENAVKFANENGCLSYKCTAENGMAHISIKNTGDGLTKDEITHIFDRFYKTDKSRGLDKTGVGLGLNIVQMIVQLHSGQVTVKSAVSEYTEFTVSIPISGTGDISAGKPPKDKPPKLKKS